MTARPPFATRADLEARHPQELLVLAADEQTRIVDPERVDRALEDVSTEIRGILRGRYSADDLDHLDEESAGLLRLYAMDMALYRVAYPPRQTEALRERYGAAVKRLYGLINGKGGLTITGPAGAGGVPVPGLGEGPAVAGSPGEVLIDAPERLFTRRRFGGAG